MQAHAAVRLHLRQAFDGADGSLGRLRQRRLAAARSHAIQVHRAGAADARAAAVLGARQAQLVAQHPQQRAQPVAIIHFKCFAINI